jgi:hypothetical protein
VYGLSTEQSEIPAADLAKEIDWPLVFCNKKQTSALLLKNIYITFQEVQWAVDPLLKKAPHISIYGFTIDPDLKQVRGPKA